MAKRLTNFQNGLTAALLSDVYYYGEKQYDDIEIRYNLSQINTNVALFNIVKSWCNVPSSNQMTKDEFIQNVLWSEICKICRVKESLIDIDNLYNYLSNISVSSFGYIIYNFDMKNYIDNLKISVGNIYTYNYRISTNTSTNNCFIKDYLNINNSEYQILYTDSPSANKEPSKNNIWS